MRLAWLLSPNTVPGHDVAVSPLSSVLVLRPMCKSSTHYSIGLKTLFRVAAEGVWNGVLGPVSSPTHGFNTPDSRSGCPCPPLPIFRHPAGLNRKLASGSSNRYTLRLLPTHGQVHRWHITVSKFARSLLFQYNCTSTLKSLTYRWSSTLSSS